MSGSIQQLATCLRATEGFVNDHDYICQCRPVDVRLALAEIDRLRQYRDALDRSPYDIAPCSVCGSPVVCLPEGGALCNECSKRLEEEQ